MKSDSYGLGIGKLKPYFKLCLSDLFFIDSDLYLQPVFMVGDFRVTLKILFCGDFEIVILVFFLAFSHVFFLADIYAIYYIRKKI